MSCCHALLCCKTTDETFSWFFSLWVPVEPCCISRLVTIPILGFLESESLLCLAGLFWACWQCVFSAALQKVSNHYILLAVIQAHSWYVFLAFQLVSGCLALLIFELANYFCPCLSSLWVVAVPCYILSLLTIPVLISFRMWVVAAFSCILSLLTMPVFWLSRRWISAVPFCV